MIMRFLCEPKGRVLARGAGLFMAPLQQHTGTFPQTITAGVIFHLIPHTHRPRDSILALPRRLRPVPNNSSFFSILIPLSNELHPLQTPEFGIFFVCFCLNSHYCLEGHSLLKFVHHRNSAHMVSSVKGAQDHFGHQLYAYTVLDNRKVQYSRHQSIATRSALISFKANGRMQCPRSHYEM